MTRRLPASLVGAVLAIALCAPPSRAAVVHEPLFRIGGVPSEGPHGEAVALPGPLEKMESMAVDNGHLWVAEAVTGKALAPGYGVWPSRIDEFDAETGAFLAQPVHVEAQPESESKLPTGYGEGFGTGLAVGRGSSGSLIYAGGEVHGVSTVSIFDEAGTRRADWQGKATPGKSFGVIVEASGRHTGTVTDVAVDNSGSPLDAGDGNVVVSLRQANEIDVFHPEADGEERYVTQITGVSPSEGFGFIHKIAIDQVNGDLYVLEQHAGVGALDVFEPTALGGYQFVRKVAGPPPAGSFARVYALAVDSGRGEVYVTEESAPSGHYVSEDRLTDEFSATGTYLGDIEGIPDAFAIAVDPASHDLYMRDRVYGPDVVVPDVTTGAVTGLKPESVTLNGTVNPAGGGDATCEFEWGTSAALGKVTPCSEAVPNGEVAVAVHAAVNGLQRDVTYYYRLRAASAKGANPGEPWQDEQFTTRGAVIRGGFVSDVSATAATFGATIDPGATPTSYYFQYGPGGEYGSQAPTAPEALGSGTADVDVTPLHVQGLSPGTTYHYRVVAISEAAPGEFETLYGEDHVFTTERLGGSFSLPDGRQWELVSPPNKLGALIEPLDEGAVKAAKQGDAIAYRASSPTEHAPAGYAKSVTVLSTRGSQGWSTSDISPPHDQGAGVLEGPGQEFRGFSEDVSTALVQPASAAFTSLSDEDSESTAYLRRDYAPGDPADRCTASCYRPLVTGKPGFANVPPGTIFGEEPNGDCEKQLTCGPRVDAASPDASHVVLSSPVQLTATAVAPGAPGLYEWSAGTLQLLSVPPKGEEGPVIPAGSGQRTGRPIGSRNAISEDGSRVILEGGALGGEALYLRDVAAGRTIRLDEPQGGGWAKQGSRLPRRQQRRVAGALPRRRGAGPRGLAHRSRPLRIRR